MATKKQTTKKRLGEQLDLAITSMWKRDEGILSSIQLKFRYTDWMVIINRESGELAESAFYVAKWPDTALNRFIEDYWAGAVKWKKDQWRTQRLLDQAAEND